MILLKNLQALKMLEISLSEKALLGALSLIVMAQSLSCAESEIWKPRKFRPCLQLAMSTNLLQNSELKAGCSFRDGGAKQRFGN
jgi:hypothetical protein